MIDLRSDTVTQPTRRTCAGPWRRPRSATTCTARTRRVNRLEERVADLFGFEAALFTRHRLAGQPARRCGRWSVPGEEVLCESSAHIARAEMGAHGSFSGITMRTWTRPAASVDLPAVEAHAGAGPGAVLRVDRLRLGREHPQLRRRPGPAARAAARPCAGWPTRAGVRRPPRRRAGVERPRRHRVAAGARSAREVGDTMSVCLSKGLGAPIGSSLVLAAEPDRRGAGLAQAAGRRLATGRGRSPRPASIALDHHIERLADDHAHAAVLADAAGVAARRSRPTSWSSRPPTPPGWCAGVPKVASWSRRSDRTSYVR